MGDRTLVTYATKHGATAEIAACIAAAVREDGTEVDVAPVQQVRDVTPYQTVIVGSAVYSGRWRGEAVSFLRRHTRELVQRRVWLFQSGPIESTPDVGSPLPKKVARLADVIGVRGHATFGGKVDPEATGLMGVMAKNIAAAGNPTDCRDFDRIASWARGLAGTSSTAA